MMYSKCMGGFSPDVIVSKNRMSSLQAKEKKEDLYEDDDGKNVG